MKKLCNKLHKMLIFLKDKNSQAWGGKYVNYRGDKRWSLYPISFSYYDYTYLFKRSVSHIELDFNLQIIDILGFDEPNIGPADKIIRLDFTEEQICKISDWIEGIVKRELKKELDKQSKDRYDKINAIKANCQFNSLIGDIKQ